MRWLSSAASGRSSGRYGTGKLAPSRELSKGALNRRLYKASELALDEPGKGNGTAIFQVSANDLYADREAALASTVRHCRLSLALIALSVLMRGDRK